MSLFKQEPKTFNTFTIRPLELSDYHKNYLSVLEKLTGVGNISFENFQKTFEKMKFSELHYIFVACTNDTNSKIIGTGTLGIEQKFIRDCALKGRVEDLISLETEFTKRSEVDQRIMEAILEKASELGCYKISLESIDNHLGFYEGFGFVVDKEIEMANRHVEVGDDTEKRFEKDLKNHGNQSAGVQ